MNETMLRIEGVSKRYRLGAIGGTTLRESLQSCIARIRHKEDPNLKIGEKTHSYNEEFWALNDVSFEVKKGEAVGIIGHNGAGKSTLLKLLCQVTAPTKGKISMNGRIASMLEVGTGFHPELTGRENIYMNGAILGMKKCEIDAKMDEIIEFSEVRQFIDTPVKRYSSGMYVKLAFSVAAHLDSEIMIMDEVLAVGDMKFQQKCLKKMREEATKGKTVLYVSHNMNTIRQLCDKCVVMDHGRIIFNGDKEQAINIYLGVKGDQEYPVINDFTQIGRNWDFGKQMFLTDLTFVGKQKSIYEVGNDIVFEVGVRSKINVEKAQVILQIRDGDRERIGIAMSEPFEVIEGAEQRVRFTVSTNNLAQDIYLFNVEIIEKDEDGNYISYDNPGTNIRVKLENQYGHGILWTKSYWGDVCFPQMKTEKVKGLE